MEQAGDDIDWARYRRDHAEASKVKRARNREHSTKLLVESGIPFSLHNGGAHLIVKVRHGFVDFWPGTGSWVCRSTKKQGRGVRKLIDYAAHLPAHLEDGGG